MDYEARALGRPAPRHEPGPLPHVKNEMGRANEAGVDAHRAMSGAAVLDEFRQVTAERLAQLRRLTPGDLAAQTATPAGPGTVADLLTLRVMDSWSHEQDIQRLLVEHVDQLEPVRVTVLQVFKILEEHDGEGGAVDVDQDGAAAGLDLQGGAEDRQHPG